MVFCFSDLATFGSDGRDFYFTELLSQQPLVGKERNRRQIIEVKEPCFLGIIPCLEFTAGDGNAITEYKYRAIEGTALGKEIDQ